MLKKLIFFDVETNGTNATSSVLSISAMKIIYDDENNSLYEEGKYNRFYYVNEGEEENQKAIEINGLNKEEITRRREKTFENNEYPKYFKDDYLSFYNFCDGATHYIAHNIKFDRQFIPFILEKQFDTMIENIDIVKIPSNNQYSMYKWPKLSECASYYKIKLEEDKLHESMYDVIIMARVFYKMFLQKNESLLKFIED